MVKSNMSKFANFPKGVHGKELPKFSLATGNEQEFWVYGDRYNAEPRVNKQKVL